MPSVFSSEDGNKTASNPNQSNIQDNSMFIWLLFDEFISHYVDVKDDEELASLQQSGSIDNIETGEIGSGALIIQTSEDGENWKRLDNIENGAKLLKNAIEEAAKYDRKILKWDAYFHMVTLTI